MLREWPVTPLLWSRERHTEGIGPTCPEPCGGRVVRCKAPPSWPVCEEDDLGDTGPSRPVRASIVAGVCIVCGQVTSVLVSVEGE